MAIQVFVLHLMEIISILFVSPFIFIITIVTNIVTIIGLLTFSSVAFVVIIGDPLT